MSDLLVKLLSAKKTRAEIGRIVSGFETRYREGLTTEMRTSFQVSRFFWVPKEWRAEVDGSDDAELGSEREAYASLANLQLHGGAFEEELAYFDNLLDSLPYLPPVTSDDILFSMIEHLIHLGVRDFEQAYQAFLSSIVFKRSLMGRSTPTHQLCDVPGPFVPAKPERAQEPESDVLFVVQLAPVVHLEVRGPTQTLKAQVQRSGEILRSDGWFLEHRIWGFASDLALRKMERELLPLVRHAFRLLVEPVLSMSRTDAAGSASAPDEAAATLSQLLGLTEWCLRGFLPKPPVSRRGVSTYEPGRIRNALILSEAAEQQSNAAIRLALLMSALEALVCAKDASGSLTEEIARNTATLLKHDSRTRQVAIQQVKKLYGSRSKALHGERLESSEEDADRAKALVGAALRGAIDWAVFHEKMDSPIVKDRFFAELEEAKVSGRRMSGVSEEAGLVADWALRAPASE